LLTGTLEKLKAAGILPASLQKNKQEIQRPGKVVEPALMGLPGHWQGSAETGCDQFRTY